MTMTPEEWAEQLTKDYFGEYDGGDSEAELRELAQQAFRAAEQVAEQRGIEQAAIMAENSGLSGCNNVAAAIRARAKQQESTDV